MSTCTPNIRVEATSAAPEGDAAETKERRRNQNKKKKLELRGLEALLAAQSRSAGSPSSPLFFPGGAKNDRQSSIPLFLGKQTKDQKKRAPILLLLP